ncbi:SUN domain-containing protein 2 [Eurytemora carolleeae]|uniref:SUN domain-containing protein 2 n=1 Tax=Eurytemora carolleeae TaxID=1294199 RepID=UPI000C758410|nr:SUN domain-containing protein 2 [Eurytemora carolleeae]|eukprot:XP_023329207.1 SUN domain-containing protein 2-like [Eurytemora affinis]
MNSSKSGRPKRKLLDDSTLSSPRRSERIKESPSVDYSSSSLQMKRSTLRERSALREISELKERSRSRSRSRVLRTSHGLESENRDTIRQRIRGLDIQSDDEDELDSSSIRGDIRQPGRRLDKLSFKETLNRYRNSSIQLFQDTVDSLSSVKDRKWPEKVEVIEYIQGLDWKKPAFCLFLLISMALAYRAIVFMQKDSDPDRFVLVVAWLLAPLRQLVDGARLAALTLPDFVGRRETVGDSRVDFEILVGKILDHDRFGEIVEQISSRQLNRAQGELSSKLQAEFKAEMKAEEGNIISVLEAEIRLVKLLMNEKMQEVIESSETDTKNKMETLELSIQNLKSKMAELASSSGREENPPDISGSVQVLEKTQERLDGLERRIPEIEADISRCCSKPSDLELKTIYEEQMSAMLNNKSSAVVEKISEHFLRPEQLDSRLVGLQAQLNTLRESLSAELKLEMDKVNQELNSQVERVKLDLQSKTTSGGISAGSSVMVDQVVKKALAKYDADKTGLFDFALESAGGSIVSTRCTENYELSSAVLSIMGVPIWWETNTPRSILQPGTAPGECWAFKGSHGSVVVKLSASIMVRAVSIEHISPLSTPDGQLSSAPNQLSLAGLIDDSPVPLANITYDKTGDPVQTFWIDNSQQRFDTVELTILSNHGHPEYTCLYRIRVHGDIEGEEKVH